MAQTLPVPDESPRRPAPAESPQRGGTDTIAPGAAHGAQPAMPADAPAGGALDDAPVATTAAEERVSVASQWQLMWWRFRKHKLAMIGAVTVIFFYLVVAFADFLAYADPEASDAQRGLIAPQGIHWFLEDGTFQPHVYALVGRRDPLTFKRVYAPDPEQKVPIEFFARGFEYKLFGFIPTDRHLIGVGQGYKAEENLFLIGTDLQGRDMWSRLMYATRISLTIGLVSVAVSLVLGVVLGGLSGFYGGWIDTIVQRVIEILRSIPTIPLWMGLAAAVPQDWSVLQVYFVITIIISLIGWTELARVVRGRFLSLREEDFVMAADLVGASRARIIFVHMVPLFLSHIIAATTLALPAMIISETSLSFLGLGMRPPAISWGVLLQQAQNVQTVAISPWLLLPAVPVIIVILAFNFLGDGLRDAADPYN
jgi:peptide/nickel transport system permease protein